MMSVYPIVRIQLSFVQFSLLCYECCILSKTECKSIYYHLRRDHETSSFWKLARNKWICRETFDFFPWSVYFISHQFNVLLLLRFYCFWTNLLTVEWSQLILIKLIHFTFLPYCKTENCWLSKVFWGCRNRTFS